ncbi:ABC transporter substrate-binding protein [Chelativorans sp.]|uniref:ABC transporter substrate-binding protein n=1 Tax=Chelativorans sp. TaxID=2203393 RepID=UPI002810C294|nr:ABC transporter substrate-binding protein [Chelativorans sp.]
MAATGAMLAISSASAETVVNFAGYTGLFQDLYTKAVIEPFMKQNPDIKVVYFTPGNSAAILGALRAQKNAPQLDVAMMDITLAKAGTDEGLFAPIDETVSPHVADLYPMAKIPGVNAVGMTFDSLVLVYDKMVVKEKPDSWRALWDPAVEGKVALHATPDILGVALTIMLEKMAGGSDYNKNLDKGIEEMMTLAPHVLTWDPKPDLWGMIMAQQAAMGVGYNARAQVFADQPGSVLAASIPKEGTLFQINAVALVEDAPNAEAAKKFIDYMLSPEAQKAFTEAMFYAPTNSKAQVSPEALERTSAGQMENVLNVDWLAIAEIRDQVTQEWRRRVIPLSR